MLKNKVTKNPKEKITRFDCIDIDEAYGALAINNTVTDNKGKTIEEVYIELSIIDTIKLKKYLNSIDLKSILNKWYSSSYIKKAEKYLKN